MKNKEIKIVIARDIEDLSKQAAQFFVCLSRQKAEVKDRFSVALSGGSTPRGLYERLALDSIQRKIPWDQVHLFWGDERCVPPDHPASNYRMAYETLISKVPIKQENVHPPINGEKSDPQEMAHEYEEILRKFFNQTPEGWPRFDLVFLGIGEDGHTASLFPGTPVLQETKRWVAAPYVERLKSYRLTLTPPVFNHAAHVIFLMAGREKAGIFRKIVESGQASLQLPFQLIKPIRGDLFYFVDQSASGCVKLRDG